MSTVRLRTSYGDIVLELDEANAPKTVANFLNYVNSGHYTGTIFHRVIGTFMIQGGGFDTNMRQKPAPHQVENEAKNGLKNVKYSLAMARTSDPHSAGAQFFINTVDNAFLDYPGQDGWGYAVFGKVTEGFDVVDRIAQVPTGAQDVPREQIVIESATVE
ncbi:peptidylprolyl isomerase [Micromonospora halophytica]|uniref:Peptidyl-prolyl cis-trans isomerase n=1 Tax=Micromonospora halophytica TaxID=47864 RepID=A0A1C5ILY5_9ACTN|nr:peptidylprolyl isomerase [Micromonospora halophytica]SCG59357.1 peptidyl-prolyl cis-trans isomerase A (cyclophilin A) [Micromonospora halophytica]